ARDEEGQDIIWTITGPDATDFVIAEDSGFVPTAVADESAIARWNIVPDFEDPMGSSTDVGANGYVFTVNASDGTNTSTHEVFVRIFDVNERPEFTGTVETAITLDEHDATLDASFQEPPYAFPVIATYTGRDEEGGVTWSLTGTDAADFEIDSGGNVTFKETPSFEDPKDSGGDNVYNFTVVVTDILSKTNRRTAMQPVTVTVRDIEETGVVQVSNLDPVVGDRITFTLSDPDGGIDTGQTSLSWTLRAQESGVWQPISLGATSSKTLMYTVDEDDTGKPLRAEVSYFDRRNADRDFANRKMVTSGETAPVEADPLPNVKPRFRSGSNQAMEEGEAGRFLPDRITATDRDGDNLTFGIQDGQDSALFEINASTGQVRTVGALDFETVGGQGLLFFTVTLHDGKGLDGSNMVINDDSIDATTVVSVRVLDVEEEGVVTLSVPEPGVGTTVQATLTDGDGSISGRSWRWWRSRDGRTGWTPIPGTTSSATSTSYTTVLADAGFYLRAAVSYTDRRGGGKRAEGITALRVFGENQQPTFPATENGARSVSENSRSGTNVGAPVAAEDPENDRLTYSLSGADAASFSIVGGSGQLRVKEPLDFETRSSYQVTVDVHDGKDGLGNTSAEIDDSIDVTITVGNVDEAGVVTLTTLTATIQARVEVTAVLEDDDGPSSVNWAWHRSPNGRTDWVNLVGETSDRYTPTLVDAGNFIRATASYTDGHGQNKTASKVSPRVGDPPPVNSAPAFPATEDGKRDVPEDAQGGDAIGDPVAANDVNAGDSAVNDPLAYSLTGTDAASFTIDAGTGQIRLAQGVSLDFEGKRTYRVTVQVSDGRDQNGDDDSDAIDASRTVTISVTNINEAPVVSGNTSPSIAENSSAAIATYTAADPERDTLEWSVNSNDFWISSRGQLYFASPPDYEDGNTSFSIRVTAADPGGLTGSLDVTVAVTDVEEVGVLTISPPRGWDGTRFEAELEDDDGSPSGFSWQWERSSNRSSWDEIAGATASSYTAGADDVGSYLRVTVEYSDRRGGNKSASAVLGVRIGETSPSSNTAPAFDEAEVPRSV
ncbi:MAG: cadherin repeat domain-containing protein, partial [Acidobacteria bacterium]|nr:cadherin repeat domain-containing protein [Acidobacteriota bacterium]